MRETAGAIARLAFDAAVLALAPRPARAAATCVVLLGAIGDFVLSTGTLRRIADGRRAAGARVVLVANALWADWARGMDLADEVWAIEPARLDADYAYRAQWLRRLRAAGFAEALQPVHSRTALAGDALVRASAAPSRVGSAGDGANTPPWLKRRADGWFTVLVDCGGAGRMELLRHADFLRGAGFPDAAPAAPDLRAHRGDPPPGLEGLAYAVLAPGAGAAWRAWPATSFAEIARRLAARGIAPVLAGAPSDRAAADALRRAYGGELRDFTGRCSLGETASLLAGARIVVANESGPAHIAAAMGVPVVALLGGGHYGRFLPYPPEAASPAPPGFALRRMDCYGCNWNCIHPRAAGEPVRCIRDIGVEDAWREIEARLARG